MAVLFILAVAGFVTALVLFLREAFLAIGTLRFRLAGEGREKVPPA